MNLCGFRFIVFGKSSKYCFHLGFCSVHHDLLGLASEQTGFYVEWFFETSIKRNTNTFRSKQNLYINVNYK